MATVFTFPGKMGDAIMQWPVAFWWAKKTGQTFEAWLDEKTCAPLLNLFLAQPCVSEVKLVAGVENYNCGGQPFHMNLPTSAFAGNRIFHLGMRGFPVRQITLQTLQDSKVPVAPTPDELAETPSLIVQSDPPVNRLVIHGQAICPHNRSTPNMWRFLSSVRGELPSLFDAIVFVGTHPDREVGTATYPEWTEFDDGGDFLKLARYIAGSRAMIGVGSSPVTLAGALKIPSIRVHDRIGNDAPKVIWNNLGENQLNATDTELRTEWPKWRDRFLGKAVKN